MTTDLGRTNSIDVINERLSLAGRRVLDIGCGDLAFSRVLAEHGAHVIGIDPDPIQAEKNRKAPTDGIEFVESGAQALPFADASFDGVFFSFSLHHIPAAIYPQVFAEVGRVLRGDGFLCVIEPASGPLNDVMKHFHDEDAERAAAQAALVDLAVPLFEAHASFRYHSIIQYDSFDAFAKRHGNRSFNEGVSEADVRRDVVRADFERLGTDDHEFESRKLMVLLQRPRSEPVEESSDSR